MQFSYSYRQGQQIILLFGIKAAGEGCIIHFHDLTKFNGE